MFREAQPRALVNAVTRALTLYPDQRRWKKLVVTGMRQDFSWRHSAGEYLTLYDRLVLSLQTT
jgi:starch synthase